MLGPTEEKTNSAPAAHYVRKASRGATTQHRNQAAKNANVMMRSQRAMVDGQLSADFEIVQTQSVYLPNFFAKSDDYTLLQDLLMELERHQAGMINWSKHLKHENPDFSPTFLKIIQRMQEYFDVDVFASRLNFYRDGSDWKPFHHDSHAYGAKGVKEDFTMGASFGASRELQFLHEPTKKTFSFPQNNGDVFAFTSEVNQKFMHGVPKATSANVGPRFSIIAWGKRRTMNSRNGGSSDPYAAQQITKMGEKPVYDVELPQLSTTATTSITCDTELINNDKEKIEMIAVANMVNVGRGSSRVQGAWNRGGTRAQGPTRVQTNPKSSNTTFSSTNNTNILRHTTGDSGDHAPPPPPPAFEAQYDDE